MIRRSNRALRIVVALGLGAGAAALLGELALRFFLFGSSRFAIEHGRSLRELGFYGDRASDDEVWKLQWAMNDAARLHDADDPDPLLGWTASVERGTYRHPGADAVGARTPVLLYGDSFSAGVTPLESRFEALLERSDLAPRFALVNYGVGGYGFDQTYLLLRATIDAWADRDPIVLVGAFVDDDFDRSVLTIRGWPKPRFRLEGDVLVEPEPIVTDLRAWLDEHPREATSYLWRFVKYRRRVLPASLQQWLRGGERRLDEKRALNRALLAAVERLLAERGLRHALVGFLGEGALTKSPGCEWQEPWLDATCKELAIPLVSTREDFELVEGDGPLRWSAHFYAAGGARGHYDESGQELAFRALRRAIERCDAPRPR